MAKFQINWPSISNILLGLITVLLSGGLAYFSVSVQTDGPIWDNDTTITIDVEADAGKGIEIPTKSAVKDVANPVTTRGMSSSVELKAVNDYTVIVHYEVMRLVKKEGKTLDQMIELYPEYYQRAFATVTYRDRNVEPDTEDAIRRLNLNPDQTKVAGTETIKHDTKWIKDLEE